MPPPYVKKSLSPYAVRSQDLYTLTIPSVCTEWEKNISVLYSFRLEVYKTPITVHADVAACCLILDFASGLDCDFLFNLSFQEAWCTLSLAATRVSTQLFSIIHSPLLF